MGPLRASARWKVRFSLVWFLFLITVACLAYGVADRVSGFETMVHDYGTDMPFFEGNHVRYLYGPGSMARGYHEGLTVKELEDAVEGYKRLIMHALEPRFPPRNLHADTCSVP